MNRSVWIVRGEDGALLGAGVDKPYVDGRYAALDQAFGRWATLDAYKMLSQAVDHADALRYEACGVVLARETLRVEVHP